MLISIPGMKIFCTALILCGCVQVMPVDSWEISISLIVFAHFILVLKVDREWHSIYFSSAVNKEIYFSKRCKQYECFLMFLSRTQTHHLRERKASRVLSVYNYSLRDGAECKVSMDNWRESPSWEHMKKADWEPTGKIILQFSSIFWQIHSECMMSSIVFKPFVPIRFFCFDSPLP